MAMFRYAILRMGREWKIVCARRRIGHFPTAQSAQAAARELAAAARECGHQSEILLQGPAGDLSPVEAPVFDLEDAAPQPRSAWRADRRSEAPSVDVASEPAAS
jgi:hypothetical protein